MKRELLLATGVGLLLLAGCSRAAVPAPRPAEPRRASVPSVEATVSLRDPRFVILGRYRLRGTPLEWAVGTTPAGGQLILASGDAGATWRIQSLDRETFQLNDVQFIDLLHGWACGGPPTAAWVVRTTDGGRTWTGRGLPYGEMTRIRFTDTLHGTMWGGNGETPPGNRTVVLGTSDGGITWNRKR